MALDILSIPTTLAELERLFSSAKITITDRRNRLGIKCNKRSLRKLQTVLQTATDGFRSRNWLTEQPKA
jgi:hypothetical protein